MDRCLVLIGMMGAGKTIVGRTIAAKFDVPFNDTDKLLEYKLGRPVHQLFQLYGEAAFRAHEASILSSIEAHPSVLATGGGIVLSDENWTEIRRIGVSIFLDVDIDVLVHRLRTAKKRRPLLEVPNWEETVRNDYRRGLGVVTAHVADHQARGESLVGREKDLTVRCNC